MEEKVEKLRNAIKSNPNLSEEFKCNVGTLTDLIVTIFPDYNYSYMEGILSSLKLVNDDNTESYSSYNRDTNTLSFNTGRIFEDRIDMQHLFLNEILKASTTTSVGYEGFKEAATESISSLINADDSMKKLNPQEHLLMSIFSEIVDPSIIVAAYMNGSVVDVIAYLDTMDISKQEFDKFASSLETLHSGEKGNTSFADAEVQMIDMYKKVIKKQLENGALSVADVNSKFDKFGEMLIFNRSELISLYPHHDFSNMYGFENVGKSLGEAIMSFENQEEVLDVPVHSK
ncbi:MAG: hypothetical protein II119_03260 [Bacilli bacterium]|nr:hypothetical protein [Bacilli bacterium]